MMSPLTFDYSANTRAARRSRAVSGEAPEKALGPRISRGGRGLGHPGGGVKRFGGASRSVDLA
jgi:hypothetical protein